MDRKRPGETGRSPARILWPLGIALLVAVAGLWLKAAVDAQRPRGSEQEQIRQMLYEGERAAEQRHPAGVSRFISSDYDDGTLRAAQVRYEIGRYLQSEQSLEIEIPSETVEPVIDPGGQTGSVMFRMRVTHRGANGSGASDLQMALKLKRERIYYFWIFPGEEWRVTSAGGWEPLGEGF